MSTKATEPEPSEWLRLLTGSRLQTQISRSVALEGGALGVMGVDVAVALIVLGAGGAYDLSILALLALGCSSSLAVRALLLPGAEDAGPSLAAMRRAREAEDARAFEDSLLDDLEEDIEANEGAVARKTLLFKACADIPGISDPCGAGGAGSTMSSMEPTTTSRSARPCPRTPDGKYKYTTRDGRPLHYEPYRIPGLVGEDFLIPAAVTKFFRKLFRRKDTPAAR